MKNIQVVDGAVNSTFPVYEVTEEIFSVLFKNNTDVAFIEDFRDIEDDSTFWNSVYSNYVNKADIKGIHGTLHLTGSHVEKDYFPNRIETDAKIIFTRKK